MYSESRTTFSSSNSKFHAPSSRLEAKLTFPSRRTIALLVSERRAASVDDSQPSITVSAPSTD
jgi:hypothetical protein